MCVEASFCQTLKAESCRICNPKPDTFVLRLEAALNYSITLLIDF